MYDKAAKIVPAACTESLNSSVQLYNIIIIQRLRLNTNNMTSSEQYHLILKGSGPNSS